MNFTQIIQSNTELEEYPKRKPRATALQREEYIQLWRESQLTRHAFCKEHKLNTVTFSNWLNKINALSAKAKTEVIQLSHAPTSPPRVEFQLPNQTKIIIENCHDAEFVISILKGIIECKFN